MNLLKLFEMQKELDAKIIKEKGLEGQDLTDYMIAALFAELGETLNEWRGFKVWSNDREPRIAVDCLGCEGSGVFSNEAGDRHDPCPYCNGLGNTNPLLEELVDCLHFILSIGHRHGFDKYIKVNDLHGFIDARNELYHEPLYLFNSLFVVVGNFHSVSDTHYYYNIMKFYVALISSLGFTWDQIEQGYMDKNAVNHERQANGY